MKYIIEAKIEVDGIVDRNDIIGAIFGQTEGLFSSELDLRELQKAGRIGRIEIYTSTHGDKIIGRITVPSALDKYATALVAAMIESVDRVGPYPARTKIEKIEDVRAEKKKKILEKARAILYEWEKSKVPEDDQLLKELEEAVLKAKVVEYGPEKLPAGPEVESSEELIIVEGRADVINLLRHGFKNVVAVEGVKIPRTIQSLANKKKKVIAFLDGDRGGDMILSELLRMEVKIDQVARAPHGREVEELTGKEIFEALQKAAPIQEVLKSLKIKPKVEELELPPQVKEYVREVDGKLLSILLNEDLVELARVPVSELAQKLEELKNEVKYVVFDGIITQRLIDILSEAPREVYMIGVRVGDVVNPSPKIHMLISSRI
ncbi:MAG: DNA primase [Thaumarchaeota archaeon]|nr:DNA primase [Candidatus Geocrenenecus arthurdayi]MCL7388421.1 DNA primase [Candidatus Geocrenenecus arthurdayi]MCL7396644.1 DNA primase [Candidatus Geocrenenecus arthurdayi]MCL7401834.1 DNA primase [Candidatus Geocrenenecus arthurdayi]MCL7403048.1 DNA primase [Candidatus Geocrenenecus arthurdayi]